MMLYLKSVFLLLVSFNVFAVGLTPESLFRNASNADVTQDSVVANFLVKKTTEENAPIFYLKVVYGKEGDQKRYQQVVYDGGEMNSAQIMSIFHSTNFDTVLGHNPEQDMIHYIFYSLLFNESQPVVGYLKSLGVEIKMNAESYNKEKLKLFDKYRAYLKTNSQVEPNPLRPTTPEEKAKVHEIMNSSLFEINSDHAKIIQKNKKLYIKLNYSHFSSLFTNDEHRLSEFDFSAKGNFSAVFEEYSMLDGLHHFPKHITIKINDDIFRLQTISVKYFTETTADFSKRALGLETQAKKNNKAALVIKPKFLF